jgi:hypothetical protein
MSDKIREAAEKAARGLAIMARPHTLEFVAEAIEKNFRETFSGAELEDVLPCCGEPIDHEEFCPAQYRAVVAALIEARVRQAREEAAQIVRANCPACGGAGRQYSGREESDECEMCGRVIRALAASEPKEQSE